jgi:hypothetical protein
MWKRLILIPFRAHFDPDSPQCDKRMPEKLWAEREGILAWLVQGCLAWQREGLNPPPVVREATKEYQSEMDKIGAWITERCEVDPKAVTPFADLYADYEAWCREQGDEPMSKRRFGDRLSEKGFPPTPQPLPGGVKARKGLRLRPDQPDQPTDFPTDRPCADCAVVPNFQDNPIETEKLPRNSQTSAQEHNSTNPLIACHRVEKVSIPPSPCCGEPIEPNEDGIGVCVGCGRRWQWTEASWHPADPPEGDAPTGEDRGDKLSPRKGDPPDSSAPTPADLPPADPAFVDTDQWLAEWASDPPPADPDPLSEVTANGR